MITPETEAHLYAVHNALTIEMFLRGLTAAERRRLTRVRRALDRVQSSQLLSALSIESTRRGRAGRRARRKIDAKLSARRARDVSDGV